MVLMYTISQWPSFFNPGNTNLLVLHRELNSVNNSIGKTDWLRDTNGTYVYNITIYNTFILFIFIFRASRPWKRTEVFAGGPLGYTGVITSSLPGLEPSVIRNLAVHPGPQRGSQWPSFFQSRQYKSILFISEI